MNVYKVGIVGFGTIGQGVAQWLVRHGHEVSILTSRPERVECFATSLTQMCSRRRSRGIAFEDFQKGLSLLRAVADASAFEDVNVVIESVTEDAETKRSVLAHIAAQTSCTTVVASTTSSLSISELGYAMPDPGRFLGLHFFSPVSFVDVVEVVAGAQTLPGTLDAAIAFVKGIVKVPLCVKDGRGFLVNRIFARFLSTAVQMLETGAGSLLEIEAELSRGLMAKGPFYQADFIGLDILLRINKNLHEAYDRPGMERFPLSESLRMLCERGRLGRKTGRGYYTYTPKGDIVEDGTDTELVAILEHVRRRRTDEVSVPLHRDVALYAMVDEALYCLEEGVVGSAVDVDWAMKRALNMWKGPFEMMCQGQRKVHACEETRQAPGHESTTPHELAETCVTKDPPMG